MNNKPIYTASKLQARSKWDEPSKFKFNAEAKARKLDAVRKVPGASLSPVEASKSKKVKRDNSNTPWGVLTYLSRKVREELGRAPVISQGKDLKLASLLAKYLQECGEENPYEAIRQMIDCVVAMWGTSRARKYGWNGVPTMGVLYGYRATIYYEELPRYRKEKNLQSEDPVEWMSKFVEQEGEKAKSQPSNDPFEFMKKFVEQEGRRARGEAK